MASHAQNFGANDQSSSNPSGTGATGSTNSNDPVTGSYGNTHSSTGRSNPIHPSDPQSTAHPAYGNSTFSSPYETGGGNTGQGNGAGSMSAGEGGQGAGLGQSLHQGGHGGLGKDYHENLDAAYGHATGRDAPEGYVPLGENKGPYDTGGGNAALAGGKGSTHLSENTETASAQSPVVPDSGYRAQPYVSGNASSATPSGVDGLQEDDRSTGSKIKDMAHGVKGLFGVAGEKGRGNDTEGDESFNAVLDPHPIPFPSLQSLGEFAEEGEGEFDADVYLPSPSTVKRMRAQSGSGSQIKGRIS